MKYLSDTNQDFKCLEKYIASEEFGPLKDMNFHIATQDMGALKEFIKVKMRQLNVGDEGDLANQMVLSEIPTRYDSAVNYKIVRDLISQIKDALQKLGVGTDDFPHYSCIPTGKVNACAASLPCSSKNFLLFDSQIFNFCYIFSKAIARCLPARNQSDNNAFNTFDINSAKSTIESTPRILKIFSDILDAQVKFGTPAASKPIEIFKDSLSMSYLMTMGMEIFLVGHEFGHVYAGHLSSLVPRINSLPNQIEDANGVHTQEHEADLIGVSIAIATVRDRRYDSSVAVLGAHAFFSALEMVERYESLLENGNPESFEEKESLSHPRNSLRKSVILESVDHFVGAAEAAIIKEICSCYDGLYDHLWTKVYQRHSRLKKLSRKKRQRHC